MNNGQGRIPSRLAALIASGALLVGINACGSSSTTGGATTGGAGASAPGCDDGSKNGAETDVDCGGASCPKCALGQGCVGTGDCAEGACISGACQTLPAGCVDGEKNGTETDVDCGGADCAQCATGKACVTSADCETHACVGGACAAPGLSLLWSKRFGGNTDQECTIIRTDAGNNVLTSNYITGKVDFGKGAIGNSEQIALVKFDAEGAALWSTTYANGTKQYPNGLGVNALGNLFLCGGYQGTLKFGAPAADLVSKGVDDLYAAGFSSAGATLWAKAFGDSLQFQQFNRMAIDPQGNPVMTGWLNGNANFGGGGLNGNNVDIIVVKLDTNGGHLWSHAYGNGALQGGHGIAVDTDGNVLVSGYLNGTIDFGGGPVGGGGSAIFILKLDAKGGFVWVRAFASSENELKPHRIAVDAAGNVFLGGGKRGTVNFGGGAFPTTVGPGIYDAYLAKFDSSGNHVWSKNVGDGQDQWVNDLAVDSGGNLVVVGSMLGTMDLGGGPLTSAGGTEFGGDVFLAKLSTAGDHIFAQRYGDASQQEPKAVTIDSTGAVLLCGSFKGSIDFGAGALASAGGTDIFVTKFMLP